MRERHYVFFIFIPKNSEIFVGLQCPLCLSTAFISQTIRVYMRQKVRIDSSDLVSSKEWSVVATFWSILRSAIAYINEVMRMIVLVNFSHSNKTSHHNHSLHKQILFTRSIQEADVLTDTQRATGSYWLSLDLATCTVHVASQLASQIQTILNYLPNSGASRHVAMFTLSSKGYLPIQEEASWSALSFAVISTLHSVVWLSGLRDQKDRLASLCTHLLSFLVAMDSVHVTWQDQSSVGYNIIIIIPMDLSWKTTPSPSGCTLGRGWFSTTNPW